MIVYACADLIFATRIRATAESMGLVTRPVRDADALADRLAQVDDGKLNEPVSALLLDLEIGDDALKLLAQAKAHDPGLPVVAFGSHLAADVLRKARDAGADQVLPRSVFVVQLGDLLKTYESKA